MIPTNFDQFVFPCQFPQPSGWGPWLAIFSCQSFFFLHVCNKWQVWSSHVSRSFSSMSVTNNRYDLPMSVVNLASRSHNHPVQGTAISVPVSVSLRWSQANIHTIDKIVRDLVVHTRWLESKCAGLIFIKQSQRGFHWPMTKDRYRETPSVMVCQKKLTRDDISWYLWECISWASLD